MLGSQDSSHAGIPGSFPCRDWVGAAHGKGSAPRSFKTTKTPWNSHPERDFCSLHLGKAGFAGKGPRSRGRIFLGALPQGWIPRDGSRGTDPKGRPRSARWARHVGQSRDLMGFARSTGNDTGSRWFFLEIPIPTQSELLQFPALPARLRPVRVPRSRCSRRSLLRSMCCHSRLFMLPRDSDGIKSFQDTSSAFPLFLLRPGAPWDLLPPRGEGGSQGEFWDELLWKRELPVAGSWNNLGLFGNYLGWKGI